MESQSRVLVEITYAAVKVPYGKLDPEIVHNIDIDNSIRKKY